LTDPILNFPKPSAVHSASQKDVHRLKSTDLPTCIAA
jgi:hypothetical protein